jgi:hypothetical protein
MKRVFAHAFTLLRALPLFAAALALGFVPPAMVSHAAADEDQDIEAVKKFLGEKSPGDTWQRGPTRWRNGAINTAYPTSRFYYVFSPQYPVARAGQISTMVRIDRDGTLARVDAAQPDSFNAGLTKLDRKELAAAAIMSLTFGPFGPVAVAPGDVRVMLKAGKGKSCSATVGSNTFEVDFDGEGRCTSAVHRYRGPLPICLGGLFLPVTVPQEVPGIGHRVEGALEVVSTEPGSIAQRAGLRPGDIMVSFAGRPLPGEDTIQQMRQIVYPLKQEGGAARPVKVLRDGRVLELTVRW